MVIVCLRWWWFALFLWGSFFTSCLDVIYMLFFLGESCRTFSSELNFVWVVVSLFSVVQCHGEFHTFVCALRVFFLRRDMDSLKGGNTSPNYIHTLERKENYKEVREGLVCKTLFFQLLPSSRRRGADATRRPPPCFPADLNQEDHM